MKNIKYLVVALLTTTLWSCADEEKVMLNSNINPPVLKTPSTASFVLTKEKVDSTMATFEFSKPDYGYAAPATYDLYIAKAGVNFADSVLVTTSHSSSIKVSVGLMNSKLLSMNAIGGVSASYDLKIVSSIKGTSISTNQSNKITITITPFEEIIIYPHLNLPGNYQGWNGMGTETSRIYSKKFDQFYEGYVNMVDKKDPANPVEFKFTKVNWGDGEYSKGATDGTLVAGGGGNISLTAGGYFKVNVNTTALTYSLLQITRIGIIGSALSPEGWDNDRALTYDETSNTWSITTDLVGGKEIKFRMNNKWDVNYGDTGADFKLEEGGDNIAIPQSGNYTITLNLSNAYYKYTIKKN